MGRSAPSSPEMHRASSACGTVHTARSDLQPSPRSVASCPSQCTRHASKGLDQHCPKSRLKGVVFLAGAFRRAMGTHSPAKNMTPLRRNFVEVTRRGHRGGLVVTYLSLVPLA